MAAWVNRLEVMWFRVEVGLKFNSLWCLLSTVKNNLRGCSYLRREVSTGKQVSVYTNRLEACTWCKVSKQAH